MVKRRRWHLLLQIIPSDEVRLLLLIVLLQRRYKAVRLPMAARRVLALLQPDSNDLHTLDGALVALFDSELDAFLDMATDEARAPGNSVTDSASARTAAMLSSDLVHVAANATHLTAWMDALVLSPTRTGSARGVALAISTERTLQPLSGRPGEQLRHT